MPPEKTRIIDWACAADVPPQVEPLRRGELAVTISPRAHVRPVLPAEADHALELLFADDMGGTQSTRERVKSFQKNASQKGYDLQHQLVGVYDDEPVCSSLFVPHAGRTAFVITASKPGAWKDSCSDPDSDAEIERLTAGTLSRCCWWAIETGSNLLQIVTDPLDVRRRDLCVECGFQELTDLLYMARSVTAPVANVETPSGMEWVNYDIGRHELFKKTIAQTYRDSLDCPELESLRDIDDIVDGHRAAGPFDGQLWWVLLRCGKPIGVVLLARLGTSETMELTYMGLVPDARGLGLGELLLRQAIALTAQHKMLALALAVDCRNKPAYHLYRRLGFSVMLRKKALIYSSKWR